ncbi:hypothetical protein ENBRE01_2261 [Enteropsectra breve]|nr:hypothetical protein ENBRE01_2261 [Enteropsectra breve]
MEGRRTMWKYFWLVLIEMISATSKITFPSLNRHKTKPRYYLDHQIDFTPESYPEIDLKNKINIVILCQVLRDTDEINWAANIYNEVKNNFEEMGVVNIVFAGAIEREEQYALDYLGLQHQVIFDIPSASPDKNGSDTCYFFRFFSTLKPRSCLINSDVMKFLDMYDLVIAFNMSQIARNIDYKNENLIYVDMYQHSSEILVYDFADKYKEYNIDVSEGFQKIKVLPKTFMETLDHIDQRCFRADYLEELANSRFYLCDIEDNHPIGLAQTLSYALKSIVSLEQFNGNRGELDITVLSYANLGEFEHFFNVADKFKHMYEEFGAVASYRTQNVIDILTKRFSCVVQQISFTPEELILVLETTEKIVLRIKFIKQLSMVEHDYLILRCENLVITNKDTTLSKAISSGRLFFYEASAEKNYFISEMLGKERSDSNDSLYKDVIIYKEKGKDAIVPFYRDFDREFMAKYGEFCSSKRAKGARWQCQFYTLLQDFALKHDTALKAKKIKKQ